MKPGKATRNEYNGHVRHRVYMATDRASKHARLPTSAEVARELRDNVHVRTMQLTKREVE